MNQRKVANHKYPQDNSVPTERLEVVFLDVIQQETNRQVSDYEGHDHPNNNDNLVTGQPDLAYQYFVQVVIIAGVIAIGFLVAEFINRITLHFV